jgi:hypothetical protein
MRGGGVDRIGTTTDREEDVHLSEPPIQPSVPPSASPEGDAVTTAARLVLGTVSLGMEALGSRLQARGRPTPASEETGSVPSSAEATGSAADVMVALAARGARTAASVGVRGAELATRGLRRAAGATDVLARLVPDFLNEPLDQARERARERIRRLGAAGHDELARSRAIARDALDDGLESLIGRLADSRELQLVIRTQSVTAGEQAVDSMRSQTARVDDRLEGAARKLLRRPPRPPAATPQ